MVAPAIPAVPPRPDCRSFVPTHTDCLIVGQQEFRPPQGLTVINWADPTVARKDRAGTRSRPACRLASSVTELIVHETASTRVNRAGTGRPNVHLVLHRDGTFTQHADLVQDLNHANHHNRASFGFETVNPVLPRIAGAPNNGLPPDTDAFPVIQNTTWTARDKECTARDDEGKCTSHRGGALRNRNRHYVRPTDAQLEAATLLIEWATDSTQTHGMDIPRDWLGIRGDFLLFGRDDLDFAHRIPGIYAHGYYHHSDGYFIVLYAWLRLELGLTPQQALTDALDIAANDVSRRRERRGLANASHADLSEVIRLAEIGRLITEDT